MTWDGKSLDQVYLFHLPAIEKMAAHACRKYGFHRQEVEDFTQEVKLKILADDYAVLRKFQGRSCLNAYLLMVVQRALSDHVNHLWGKWRPSAEAKRLGTLAVQLETLLIRDRYSFGEACRKLWTDHGVKESESELAALAARLRPRLPRWSDSADEPAEGGAGRLGGDPLRHSPEPQAAPLAGAPESADERLRRAERESCRRRVWKALAAALAELPAEDRLIARMSAEFSIVEIARLQHLEQKPLYSRREKILKKLRRALECAGVSAEDVAEILGHADT